MWEKPPELGFVDLAAPKRDIDDALPDLPQQEDLSDLVDPPDHLLPAVLPRPTMPPPGLDQQDGISVSRWCTFHRC